MTDSIKKISVQGSAVALEDEDAQSKIQTLNNTLTTNDTVAKANSAVQPAAISDMETKTHASSVFETIENVNTVKTRVSVLETTVGDSTSGLVKGVADLNTTVATLGTGKADKATTLAGYGITDAYTKTEVDGKISGAFHYKGSVDNYSDLPTSGQVTGDVWNIKNADEEHGIKAGDNVVWNGTAWDVLGGTVDLSAYRKATDQDTIDSTITSNINTHKADTTSHITSAERTTWNAKQDAFANATTLASITADQLTQINTNKTNITNLDTNKVSKTTTVNGHALTADVTVSASDVGAYTKTEVDTKLSTKVDTTSLATVATSGSYTDLTNKPSIPSKTSELTNDSDYTTKAYADTELAKKQNTLTDTQLNAANSGITTEKRTNYDAHLTNEVKHITADERTLWNTVSSKSDKTSVEALTTRVLTSEGKITTLEGKVGDTTTGLIKDVANLETNKADKSTTYTKTEVDTKLGEKQATLTETQLLAVNSGVTATKVATYDGYATTIANKQDKLDTDQLKAVNSGVTAQYVYQIDTNKENIAKIGTNTTEGVLKTLNESIGTKQSALSETQMASVNSGMTNVWMTKISEAWPGSSGSSNKLATLNDISTSSGSFLGSYAKMSNAPYQFEELETPPQINDYMVLYNIDVDETITTDEEGTWSFKEKSKLPETAKDGETWRFKYYGNWYVNYRKGWVAEYRISDTPMTEEQIAALNSGITQAKRESYDTHIADTDIHVTTDNKATWNAKQNALTEAQLTAVNSGIDSTKVAQIATNKTDIANLDTAKANKATNLAGYGITDAYTKTEVNTELDKKANNATTLSGYGITDAYTKTETNDTFVAKTTTVNGYALSDNVDLTYTDVDALSDTTKYGATLATEVKTDKVEVSLKDQDTNTLSTVNMNVFTGASEEANGSVGLVPQPNAGDQGKFLRADGTWVVNQDATWGKITGTLSAQTDLQDALDLKATVEALNTEKTNRETADTEIKNTIGGSYTTENTVASAISANATAISAEETRAKGVEGTPATGKTLAGMITDEITRATTAEGTLTSNLSSEASTREEADTAINNKIGSGFDATNTVAKAISDEKTRAEESEGTLTTSISTEATTRANADTAINEKIGDGFSKTSTVASAISANTTAISTETSARETADTTLQTNIDTEASTRSSADTALDTRLTSVEGKISADASSTNKLTDKNYVDTQVATKENPLTFKSGKGISVTREGDEVTVTNTQVSAVWGNITGTLNNQTDLKDALALKATVEALNNEVARAKGVEGTIAEDKTLAGLISEEASARATAVSAEETRATGAESTLQTNINTEATTRASADTALDTRVTNIEGKISADASSTNKLTDKSYVDTELAKKQNNLTEVQLSAVNSGITSTKVGNYDTHIADTDIHVTTDNKATWNAKQDALSEEQLTAVNSGIDSTKVAQIATNATNITSLSKGKADKATTLSGYGITDAYTKTEIDGKFTGVFHIKSSVATVDDLPLEGNTQGDCRNVLSTGDNYVWTSSASTGTLEDWDKLSGIVDLSAYRKSADQDTIDDGIKETITTHTGNTSNPHNVTKAQVGLGNVDNTSDANKPISTATQTALNAKADASDLTSHTSNTSNPHSVTAEQVGLGNVNNTADLDKPVSTATQTELDKKVDKTFQINGKALNGTSLATEDLLPAQSVSTENYILSSVKEGENYVAKWMEKGNVLPEQASHSGHFLTTDGTDASWSEVTKSTVGLGNVDNTSDLNKPISTATQTALDLKADDSDLTSHTGNTSNPHSVTKAQVGLGNVDNTSDLNKPISTATQTALDAKANSSDLATVATSGSYNDLLNKPNFAVDITVDSTNKLQLKDQSGADIGSLLSPKVLVVRDY